MTKLALVEIRPGHGSVGVSYRFRADFEAVERKLDEILTAPQAAQHLADYNMTECANGHKHTCTVSIVNNETFGDIDVVCVGSESVSEDDSDDPCKLHLENISRLCFANRQAITNMLANERICDQEERFKGNYQRTVKYLTDASTNASVRFANAPREFKENCFNRISALHFRVEDTNTSALNAVDRQREEGFDVEDIRLMHCDWDLDTTIDECLAELAEVRQEAKEYMYSQKTFRSTSKRARTSK